MHRIKKGLDLPIAGEPVQEISNGPDVTEVALIGPDYIGMKPTLAVQPGDRVKTGQLLFSDKKTEGVQYTSPGAGEVVAVNRGAKRVFQSLTIRLDGSDEQVEFTSYRDADLTTLSREQVRDHLVESGLWTAFRKRPFSKVPSPQSVPRSIFVTAIDTEPLSPNPEVILLERERDFHYGLQVIRHLTDGGVHVCKAPGFALPGKDVSSVQIHEFDGPHPAGLPGTHIHFIDPVSLNRTVWYIGYQDVLAIGKFFTTGTLDTSRVISLAGPTVTKPRLIRTRLGANLSELTKGELTSGVDNRVISGSVLSGRQVREPFHYLGRYHVQVSALAEGGEREFLGWQKPGFDKFSIKRVFASAFSRGKKFSFTTSTEGSPRAMVPIGMYEAVMPLDIIPTFLLRSLIIDDTDQAQALGCLELDEEDLALCTFVCPGKYVYGPILRKNLTRIEIEG